LVGRDRITMWTTPFRKLAMRLDWRASARSTTPASSEGH